METVKKDPPDYKSILKFLAQNPSAIPSALGVAVDEGKRRLAENINPRGYSANFGETSPAQRIYEALILNKPEPRSFAETSGKWDYQSDDQLERIDLFNMYLGRDQPYGSIPDSEYGSEDTPLYSSPTTERTLKNMIEDAYSDEMRNSNEYRRTSKGWHPMHELEIAFLEPDYHNPIISHKREGNVLGNFTAKVKEDDKGTYVEYQDVWDLAPYPNMEKAGLLPLIEKAIGANPPKIYGRIYFDPETGEIQENK
jgi:hypothetical protein